MRQQQRKAKRGSAHFGSDNVLNDGVERAGTEIERDGREDEHGDNQWQDVDKQRQEYQRAAEQKAQRGYQQSSFLAPALGEIGQPAAYDSAHQPAGYQHRARNDTRLPHLEAK